MSMNYHPSLVHSLHSRSVGILLDPSRHCKDPLCASCASSIQYERDFQDLIKSKKRESASNKLIRSNSRPLFVDGIAIPSSMHRRASKWKSVTQTESQIMDAFSMLAPPASSSALYSRCVRLHLVLTSLRKLIQSRVKLSLTKPMLTELVETELWYLTLPEFTRLLLASGVNWMSKAQIESAYIHMDLNKSKKVHVTEFMEIIEEVDLVTIQLIRGDIKTDSFNNR